MKVTWKFLNLRWKRYWFFNFFFIENLIKLLKMVLKGVISWVTYSDWANGISYTIKIYQWKKLWLFILFVCHIDISQTTMPLAMLLIRLESPWWGGVQWVGFIMFQPMVEKWSNVESFSNQNSFKSKTKIARGILGMFLALLESPQ
jgi:hypothetical protein